MDREPSWLAWAKELQALAQTSLAYDPNIYDRERWERVRQIAAEMVSSRSDNSIDEVTASLCVETGYQTPKIDTRAAVFQEDKVLLVQEANDLWAMPGGWMDFDLSIRENTVKETLEEAGYDVEPLRLVAMQDRARHNTGISMYAIQKAFVLCRLIGGQFRPNVETIACGFFPLDALPPLAETKTTADQIALCLRASHADTWETVFD